MSSRIPVGNEWFVLIKRPFKEKLPDSPLYAIPLT
jgi:hypothetical protein